MSLHHWKKIIGRGKRWTISEHIEEHLQRHIDKGGRSSRMIEQGEQRRQEQIATQKRGTAISLQTPEEIYQGKTDEIGL